MGTFRVLIDTANAAFEEDENAELARILRGLVSRLEDGQPHLLVGESLLDYNGNIVGRAQIVTGDGHAR